MVVLSLIHISEPTRLGMISYAVFCLKKIIFLMIRRPPRSTRKESLAASDVYKRQQPYQSMAHFQKAFLEHASVTGPVVVYQGRTPDTKQKGRRGGRRGYGATGEKGDGR